MDAEYSSRRRGYTWTDVFRFAVSYWVRQPKRLTVILCTITVAVLLETNLPNALSAFFEAIRLNQGNDKILFQLALFLATYFGYATVSNANFRNYNVFENNVFNALLNDAFAHVE